VSGLENVINLCFDAPEGSLANMYLKLSRTCTHDMTGEEVPQGIACVKGLVL